VRVVKSRELAWLRHVETKEGRRKNAKEKTAWANGRKEMWKAKEKMHAGYRRTSVSNAR
jgi:hypothetical protein